MALPDPDTLMTRLRTAEELTAAGYPISPGTLSTKATRGGGPPFSKFGTKAIYRWGDSLAWARARLTPARSNTSQADSQQAA